LGPERLWSEEVDAWLAQIVSKTIAVDMHNHVQVPFVKEAGAARSDPDFDLAGEMRRSGLSAVVETYNLDGMLPKRPGENYRCQQQALAFEDRLLAKSQMRRALNLKDREGACAAAADHYLVG
jgi:membrane dipeptidase